MQSILGIHLPIREDRDKLSWIADSKGHFSLKSSYALMEMSLPPNNCPLDREHLLKLWKLPLQDRLKLLSWKSAWNAISCKSKLLVLHLQADNSYCSLCNQEEESLEHFSSLARRLGFYGKNLIGRWFLNLWEPGTFAIGSKLFWTRFCILEFLLSSILILLALRLS